MSGKFGIDGMGFYIPTTFVKLENLAQARGVDPRKYTEGLGQESFAVALSDEDTVTMAANALQNLLQRTEVPLSVVSCDDNQGIFIHI